MAPTFPARSLAMLMPTMLPSHREAAAPLRHDNVFRRDGTKSSSAMRAMIPGCIVTR